MSFTILHICLNSEGFNFHLMDIGWKHTGRGLFRFSVYRKWECHNRNINDRFLVRRYIFDLLFFRLMDFCQPAWVQ